MAEPSAAAVAGGARILEVSEASVSFGAVRALTRASIEVGPGEIVGLIGPNGAGKTTLVNLISGMLPEWSGDVRIDGRSIKGLRPDQIGHRGVGRTFQVAQPLVGMTALELSLIHI